MPKARFTPVPPSIAPSRGYGAYPSLTSSSALKSAYDAWKAEHAGPAGAEAPMESDTLETLDSIFGDAPAPAKRDTVTVAKDYTPHSHPDATGYVTFADTFPDAFAQLNKGRRDKLRNFAVPTYSGYEYPSALASLIPAQAPTYLVEPMTLYRYLLAYSRMHVTHVVGPPGTGKSTGLPELLAFTARVPCVRRDLSSRDLVPSDLVGSTNLVRITDEDGSQHTVTRHVDGPLVEEIMHPCVVLLDEFARTSGAVRNALMPLLERDGALHIPTRTPTHVVKRHSGCWLVATDNTKGLGDNTHRMVETDQIDAAVLDRYDVTVDVGYLPASTQQTLLHTWEPSLPATEAKRIAQFVEMCQQAYQKDQLPLTLSPRGARSIASLTVATGSVQDAINMAYTSKLGDPDDVACVRQFINTVWGV